MAATLGLLHRISSRVLPHRLSQVRSFYSGLSLQKYGLAKIRLNTDKIQRTVENGKSTCSFLTNSLCLDTRQPGSVFKILDTRQSGILSEFSRNISFNSFENSRYLFRKLKRFECFWGGFNNNLCGLTRRGRTRMFSKGAFFIYHSGIRMVGTECIRSILSILLLGAEWMEWHSVHSGIGMWNKKTRILHSGHSHSRIVNKKTRPKCGKHRDSRYPQTRQFHLLQT